MRDAVPRNKLFTIMIMAAKATTSQNYSTVLLMTDMSEAVDSIHRVKIVEDLRTVLLQEELHTETDWGCGISTEICNTFKTSQQDSINPIFYKLTGGLTHTEGTRRAQLLDQAYTTQGSDHFYRISGSFLLNQQRLGWSKWTSVRRCHQPAWITLACLYMPGASWRCFPALRLTLAAKLQHAQGL